MMLWLPIASPVCAETDDSVAQNLDKVSTLAAKRSPVGSPLTCTWPQLVSSVGLTYPRSPRRGFIAKTLFSGGRCFLPSCLGAGNCGCTRRVVRRDRRRLQPAEGRRPPSFQVSTSVIFYLFYFFMFNTSFFMLQNKQYFFFSVL